MADRYTNGIPGPLGTCMIGYAPPRDGMPEQVILHLDTIVPDTACISPLAIWGSGEAEAQRKWNLANGVRLGHFENGVYIPPAADTPEDFA